MNELQIFNNPEFGEIRTIEEDGKVLFCATDTARALGYSNPHDAIKRHCKGVVKREGVSSTTNQHGITSKQTIEMNFITEGDIYRLAASSHLPNAEKFESWIFDEVLPSIRKHGAYMTPETLEAALLNPDTIIKIATALKEEQQKNRVLQEEVMEKSKIIDEQLPSVEFTKKVADTKDLITMAQMAKLTHDENIPLGRNKLIQWLKDKKYLRQNGEPFQQYINQGYFKVRETCKQTAYGSKVFTQTFVTGRGQIYLIEKLRKEFCEPGNVA